MNNDQGNYIDIRCQEPICPYGKKITNRCKFGEVNASKLKEPLPEKHKCRKGGNEIIINIQPSSA